MDCLLGSEVVCDNDVDVRVVFFYKLMFEIVAFRVDGEVKE